MVSGSHGTYVALLRGINVGGNRKVAMADLADVFEQAGCRAVRTYIQSGNVAFQASGRSADLARKLTTRIAGRFGFEVPVVIRSAEALEKVTRSSPFLGDEDVDVDTLHVGFMAAPPEASRVAELDADRSPPDRFRVVAGEVHLHLPNGVARSKLTNAYFDTKLCTTVTIRNWRTISKLLELVRAS